MTIVNAAQARKLADNSSDPKLKETLQAIENAAAKEDMK